MTKIVFACKSNSCRSQMAEGWAKEWLRREKEQVDRMLTLLSSSQGVDDCNGEGNFSSSNYLPGENSGKASPSRQESGVNRACLLRRSSALEEVVVVSVALDSSSVYECSTCCDDICNNTSQRKAVKEKAVRAMAEDGVDISAFVPKTIEDIVPYLIDRTTSHFTENNVIRERCADECALEGEIVTPDSEAMEQIAAEYSSTLFLPDTLDEDCENIQKLDPTVPFCASKKPVDKLIVLCSCGDDIKQRLVRRSKSVEEWKIDAPTTAAKREGDGAYMRVSREIRNEVDILFDSLIGNREY